MWNSSLVGWWGARRICTGLCCLKNHYDVLGIRSDATQSDIKSAYYKLSMTYHPDRNKGCKKAADKFCDITNAYEVLGNHRLRKLYDRGILGGGSPKVDAGGRGQQQYERSTAQSPHSHSHSHKFDFGEWTRKHYGESLARRNAARIRYNQNLHTLKQDRINAQKEHVVFVIFTLFIIFLLFSYVTNNRLDEVKSTKKHTPPRPSPPAD